MQIILERDLNYITHTQLYIWIPNKNHYRLLLFKTWIKLTHTHKCHDMKWNQNFGNTHWVYKRTHIALNERKSKRVDCINEHIYRNHTNTSVLRSCASNRHHTSHHIIWANIFIFQCTSTEYNTGSFVFSFSLCVHVNIWRFFFLSSYCVLFF